MAFSANFFLTSSGSSDGGTAAGLGSGAFTYDVRFLGRYVGIVGQAESDFTGKSLSEALIFASTNPQYDDRLFIELRAQNMLRTF